MGDRAKPVRLLTYGTRMYWKKAPPRLCFVFIIALVLFLFLVFSLTFIGRCSSNGTLGNRCPIKILSRSPL